jgi:hypothetical protein
MLVAPERNILEGTAKGGSPAGDPAQGIAAEILLALAKRLERKARFAAFYGLVAILQSKIAARPCSLPQMRQNSESE